MNGALKRRNHKVLKTGMRWEQVREQGQGLVQEVALVRLLLYCNSFAPDYPKSKHYTLVLGFPLWFKVEYIIWNKWACPLSTEFTGCLLSYKNNTNAKFQLLCAESRNAIYLRKTNGSHSYGSIFFPKFLEHVRKILGLGYIKKVSEEQT